MSDILGHDIDGRPLRAGDEVVIVGIGCVHFGATTRVIGLDSHNGSVSISIPYPGIEYKWYCADGHDLKKLMSDHRPANESFGEMMGKFTNNRVEG